MYKKFLISLLCFSLSWTAIVPAYAAPPASLVDEQAIRAQYPDAQVIHVSPEDYPALERRLSREGYRASGDTLMLSANGSQTPYAGSPVAARSSSDDCYEPARDRRSDDDSLRLAVQITSDLTSNRGGNNGGAAVVFVVVGAVVLVVWTLYVFKYLYDASFGLTPCGRWSELTASSSSIFSDADQYARFTGLHYLGGFRKGSTDVGISAEVGHANIRLAEASAALDLKGVYWWIGPMLRWRMGDAGNPNYFQMEFLAGSTEHDEMGLMALAKMGLSFGVGDGLRWGLGFGAINMDLNETQGIITDRNQYHYLLGLDLGYRF